MRMTDKGFYGESGAITPAAFRTVTYVESRIEFFRGKRRKAERKLRKAMKRREKDSDPHAWADTSVDDAACVLSYYNDVVKMLEDNANERNARTTDAINT